MPIGTDDGQYHEDQMSYLISQARGSNRSNVEIRPVQDESTIPPTMPPGASREPAGALKPAEGTETPEKVLGQEFTYPTPYGLNPPEKETSFPRPRLTEMLSGLYDTAKNALSLTQAP